MSPERPRESPENVQLTLDGSVSGDTDRADVVYRIEPHGRYLRCIQDRTIQHVMVNLSDAVRVVENRGGFDQILGPDHTLTITGTEDDEVVLNRSRYDVVDFYAQIDRPVQVIPDWAWAYEGTDATLLEKGIDRYWGRFEWLYTEAQKRDDLDHVEFRPLAKGLGADHYKRAVETYDRLGINKIAIYGAQTPSLKKLTARTEQAVSVFDPESLMVIGRAAPQDVVQFPKQVDAVAGLRNWKKACNLTADGYSQSDLTMWHLKVKKALLTGSTDLQTGLGEHFPQEVKTDGGQ